MIIFVMYFPVNPSLTLSVWCNSTGLNNEEGVVDLA